MASSRLTHPWPPIFDADCRVLLLGTFPSPQSRAAGYPFGHPQNLFWTILAKSLGKAALPQAADRATREAWLLANHVALWDVLAACDIDGASDASIRNPIANQFRPIIAASRIAAVFTTGRQATQLFNRLCSEEAGLEARYLPSTSPANRASQARPEFWDAWAEVGSWAKLR